MVDFAENQVLIPGMVQIDAAAVFADEVDFPFNQAELVAEGSTNAVQAPDVGGVGIEQLPDEVIHGFSFHVKEKAELGA